MTKENRALAVQLVFNRGAIVLALLVFLWRSPHNLLAERGPEIQQAVSFQEYVQKSVVSRGEIDQFLAGPSWAQFDPELGYTQRNFLGVGDGIDRTSAIYTFQQNGARTSFIYSNRRPRINTYGDSFTECEQVSDGETWQEYLAGRIGEPIGNFGIGGYGVYQAARRLIREEKTNHGAQYLIFYIWGDDPIRSLFRSRYADIYRSKNEWDVRGNRFHGNFWVHVEMDLETGRFLAKENLLPTQESLYNMTQPQWMVEHLKDDLALQLDTYAKGYIKDLNREQISKLASRLDFPFDWGPVSQESTYADKTTALPFGVKVYTSPGGRQHITPLQSQAAALLNRYAQRGTIFVLAKLKTFAHQNSKQLLVVLNMTTAIEQSGTRDDDEILDYLKKEKFDYFDANQAQLQDFEESKSNITYREYMKQFLVRGNGHYNPHGNHFFAYAIANKIVEWLDPKPLPYREPGQQPIDFEHYMHH
jgi:hypothetical protein